jgi:hypothetical protein
MHKLEVVQRTYTKMMMHFQNRPKESQIIYPSGMKTEDGITIFNGFTAIKST